MDGDWAIDEMLEFDVDGGPDRYMSDGPGSSELSGLYIVATYSKTIDSPIKFQLKYAIQQTSDRIMFDATHVRTHSISNKSTVHRQIFRMYIEKLTNKETHKIKNGAQNYYKLY